MWSSRHQALTVTIVAIRIVQKQENELTDTPSSSWRFYNISLYNLCMAIIPFVCLADFNISQSNSTASWHPLCDDNIISSLSVTLCAMCPAFTDIITRIVTLWVYGLFVDDRLFFLYMP